MKTNESGPAPGTNEEIEQTLETWLLETIQQLEKPSERLEEPSEQPWLREAAEAP